MDNVSYVQLPLEYLYNHWEAPILEKLEDEDSSNPAIPSPTIDQAQEAIQQFAKSNTDNTSKLITSGLVRLISIKQDCKLDGNYGMVSCNVQLSWRDKNDRQEDISDREFAFYLKGSEWQFAPFNNVNR